MINNLSGFVVVCPRQANDSDSADFIGADRGVRRRRMIEPEGKWRWNISTC